MEFMCPEGHRVFTTWEKLRRKRDCPTCNSNRLKSVNFEVIPKKKDVYRILSLDQSTHLTGWSIYDEENLIAYGVYESKTTTQIERMNEIKEWLLSMIVNWKPDFIGLEGIQYQSSAGVTTFEALARLQGVLMQCCFENRIPFEICHTATWRQACGVKGKSRTEKKRSMRELVKSWFDIWVSEDEADAIGIGRYCVKQFKPQKVEFFNWE